MKLLDGPGNSPSKYLRAIDSVKRLRADLAPVLVHCHAGRSRSVIVVASHLIRDHGYSLAEAMTLIASKRDVLITAGLQEVLDFH